MRQTVFLDTSYLIALIRKKDARHPDALAAASIFTGRFVTTDLVLVELANSLSLPPNRAAVISAIERIRTDAATTIISFTSEGMERALTLFKSSHDKSWGLVDCFFFCGYERKTDT
ncbi:hypothetical protein KsCSTR_16360 [Candidatus Kuenenia stuttgartiensis]|uniref:PIN domain-containing protein n=1 Tax=Kuenenia stuttgartiensis TaxID=174633 RepID=Q1Q1V4_KUEST|nr:MULTISPECIES: PIN domain-containing protein [Kuenenia]MCZ7621581.1 PIN domain-containing protein [Candidatus Kuenenia sp.]QII11015.1 hypothetical protein KsCSTR_16360 [Candidatus Kuenenia stuttgartiensis]CAJ73986.1 conserved hypothetical protein [Candidatus Kuenenia stuttgartiensis]